MKNLIVNEGFYWENFSSDIKSLIKECKYVQVIYIIKLKCQIN